MKGDGNIRGRVRRGRSNIGGHPGRLVCIGRQNQKAARDQLESLLENANYPVSDFDVRPFGQNEIQIFATLQLTSVDSDELDNIVAKLTALTSVSQAYWSSSTFD